MNTIDRRAELSKVLLLALEATWKATDESGQILDPAMRLGVLRGGCRAFLDGEFDALGDAISLGLAFLTLARESLILSGRTLEVKLEPAEGGS